MALSAQLKIAFAAAVAAVLGTASPALATGCDPTPVGTWDGTVTVEGAPTQHATLYFTDGGKACAVFGVAPRISTAVGTWRETKSDRFTFKVTRTATDPVGLPITVKAEQKAVQTGETYTSTGTSKVYNEEGTLLGTYPSSSTATRTSTEVPAAGCS